MNPALERKLAAQLGVSLRRATATRASDINDTYEIELDDGRVLFVKTHGGALPGLYACEAQGLTWLRAAHALRVPDVLASSEADMQGPGYLVLERIEQGRPASDYDEQLGTGLAALHRAGAPQFGLAHDNYLATLPQDNRSVETWGEFYAMRRIAPQLERALRAGHIPSPLQQQLERLVGRIPELVGPEEPPARLHGDLWGGNVICDELGGPVLIDPAVYGGSREIDLAMMHLFGGFSERVFAAYDASYPLCAGHRERTSLYQLYPLLVHVNLFGSSYVPQLERCSARWA
jgi:fructosamine-3-kinase